MEPSSIFVLIRRTIKEDHLTFVPSLVGFSNVGKVERSKSIRGIWANSGHPSFVAFPTVGRVTVIPNIYGDFHSLKIIIKNPLFFFSYFISVNKLSQGHHFYDIPKLYPSLFFVFFFLIVLTVSPLFSWVSNGTEKCPDFGQT